MNENALQSTPGNSNLIGKSNKVPVIEGSSHRPSAYSKKNVVRIMIIYFNIDRRNLLSFAAILNFAVLLVRDLQPRNLRSRSYLL